jgi:hypothetical protein
MSSSPSPVQSLSSSVDRELLAISGSSAPRRPLALVPAAATSPNAPFEPPYGDGAFQFFADFLAREMGFNLLAASDLPVRWYREQIGLELCSIPRGAALRMLVMDACRRNFAEKWKISYEPDRPRPKPDPNRIQMGIAPRSFWRFTKAELIWAAILIAVGAAIGLAMPW